MIWAKATDSGFPLFFYKIVGGPPFRIWVKANSPSDAFKPNMNLPNFRTRIDAEKYMNKNYKQCEDGEYGK